MFKNIKIEDRVYDLKYKWGTVTRVDEDVFFVYFDMNKGKIASPIVYYFNGKEKGFDTEEYEQTLFWNKPKFKIPEKPFILKEWLIKNFKKKEFEKGKDNYVFIVNYSTDSFDRDIWEIDVRNYFEQMGSLYFEIISDKISLSLQKELNDNSISVKTFYDTLKELGWL